LIFRPARHPFPKVADRKMCLTPSNDAISTPRRERLPHGLQTRAVILIGLALIGLMSSSASAQTMRDAIEDVQPKLVKIYGAGGYKNLESYGSGFVVSPDGFIATVWSHLLDAAVITVVLDDGRRFEAELIGAEPRLELAVL